MLLHHNQKAVQQIEIGLGMGNGKNHHGLIHIGHRRADQLAGTGQEGADIPCFFHRIQQIDLHIVPHQGFYLFFAENPFRLTLISSAVRHMHIIEPRNPFYNFTPHKQKPSYSGTNSILLCTDLLSDTPFTVDV